MKHPKPKRKRINLNPAKVQRMARASKTSPAMIRDVWRHGPKGGKEKDPRPERWRAYYELRLRGWMP